MVAYYTRGQFAEVGTVSPAGGSAVRCDLALRLAVSDRIGLWIEAKQAKRTWLLPVTAPPWVRSRI